MNGQRWPAEQRESARFDLSQFSLVHGLYDGHADCAPWACQACFICEGKEWGTGKGARVENLVEGRTVD